MELLPFSINSIKIPLRIFTIFEKGNKNIWFLSIRIKNPPFGAV